MTATMTPKRTDEQRHEALRRANHVRNRRAQIKRDLHAGRRSIEALLRNPPAELATMKIADLVLQVPKYGRVKTHQVLTRCRIAPSKTLAGLTLRQRAELLSMLRTIDTRMERGRAERAQAKRRAAARGRSIAA